MNAAPEFPACSRPFDFFNRCAAISAGNPPHGYHYKDYP